MLLSIIIPTYSEEESIGNLLSYLQSATDSCNTEIIVVDGGSPDQTVTVARRSGTNVIRLNKKGRAFQMNEGAREAKGDILYFLHADTFPPANFISQIYQAIEQGYNSGCFRLRFDYSHWFLKFNCWFTRFGIKAVRFGDQSLFVTKEVFRNTGGFNEKLIMMEDQEIISRMGSAVKFIVLKDHVVTSARKYLQNGVYRLQGIFFYIYLLYFLGYSQETLLRKYRSFIVQDKI